MPPPGTQLRGVSGTSCGTGAPCSRTPRKGVLRQRVLLPAPLQPMLACAWRRRSWVSSWRAGLRSAARPWCASTSTPKTPSTSSSTGRVLDIVREYDIHATWMRQALCPCHGFWLTGSGSVMLTSPCDGAAAGVWEHREVSFKVRSKDLLRAVKGPCKQRGIRCTDMRNTGQLILFERM